MPAFATARWGARPWGARDVTPGTGAVLDVSSAVADVWYRLGFAGAADLAAAGRWVGPAELYQWADEAAKKLAYLTGAFITYDTSMTAVAGTAAYALPANHVFTLHAFLAGVPLRITRQSELESLDATWEATGGPAARVSFDAREVGMLVLYPNPTSGGVLSQVCAEFPATVDASHTTLALPTVLQDYFTYAMLSQARLKESDGRMEDVGNHAAERVKLFEQIVLAYFGRGQ